MVVQGSLGEPWQLSNKVADPKVSTLRKLAVALGVHVSASFDEPG
jgi:hypothetical protein